MLAQTYEHSKTNPSPVPVELCLYAEAAQTFCLHALACFCSLQFNTAWEGFVHHMVLLRQQSCTVTLCQLSRVVQDVIVKVTLSSICGSDMHPYLGKGVPLDHGITFGHEYTGVIVETGPEVSWC